MRPDSQAASRADGSKASAPIIRVLIAEDHTTLRYTLRSILQRYPEIDIVGEATNGEEAVMKAKELEPAIVLMDISMPRVDGIEATRRIKAQFSEMAVLGLSVDTGGYSVNAILKAGAVAVVPKEKVLEDLYPAIQQALHHRSQAELPRERSLPLTQIP
jgi:DNA-binding NarL/FixJ family response regulator